MEETSGRKRGWLKEKAEKGKLFLTNRIDSRKLQPGDHIYAYRGVQMYSHHGIYVGPDEVIHFIPTEPHTRNKESEEGNNPCPKCGHQENVHIGVVKSCLDCFLAEGSPFAGRSLFRYQYGVPQSWHDLKRGGTCSTQASKPANEVIGTAFTLFTDNGFGNYDLFRNNCESFATYCKTGKRESGQVDSAEGAAILFAAVAAVTTIDYFANKWTEDKAEDAEKKKVDHDD